MQLNETIDEYGINSKEALEISQLVDLVINVINKEKKKHLPQSASFHSNKTVMNIYFLI